MNKEEHYEIIKNGILNMLRHQAFTDDTEMSLVLSFIKAYGLIRNESTLPGCADEYSVAIDSDEITLIETRALENVDYVFKYFY